MPDLAYESMLDDEHGVMLIVGQSDIPDGIAKMKLIVDKTDGWLCHNVHNFHRLPALGAAMAGMPQRFDRAIVAAVDVGNTPRAVAIIPLEVHQ